MKKRISSLLILVILLIPVLAFSIQKVSILPLTIQVKSSTTTITGTAGKVPATALVGRENIAIFNVDSSTESVWCGASDVTSSNGFPLTSVNPAISLDLDDSVAVWCVSDGTSVDMRSLETK